MYPSNPTESPSVYRPLTKYRALAWAQGIMYLGLAGFAIFTPLDPGQPLIWLALLVGGVWVLGFGLVVLLSVETLRLEVSPRGLVYRNAFGRVAASREQVTSLGRANRQVVLLLDENRYERAPLALWSRRPPYSTGHYIPIYLFLDAPEDPEQLARAPLGRDLLRLFPAVLEPITHQDEAVEPEVAGTEQAAQPEGADRPETILLAGRYRLRSRSSIYIIAGVMLIAPLVMALAGLFGGAQAVLLPGLLAGWIVPLLLGGIEVRPTPLTDLLGLAAVLLLGGLSALFLLAGCAAASGKPGCTADGTQANLFAFFLLPLIMYLIPWLIFTRLPLLLRRK